MQVDLGQFWKLLTIRLIVILLVIDENLNFLTQDGSYCRESKPGSLFCRIKDIYQLHRLITEPTNITYLDLSHNNIRIIANQSLIDYKSLEILSLAYNDIRVLTYEAFYGLVNLKTLNISENPLQHFSGNLTGLFPSLSILDASGIVAWKPEKELFQLRMLQRVIGLTWSAECQDCFFYRSNKTYLSQPLISKEKCYKFAYQITNLSPIGQFLRNTSFTVACQDTLKCQSYKTDSKLVKTTNHCWDETLAGINFQSLFGFIGVIVNLIVVVNILASKTLRNNISMLFVCNMAVSDFLLSVYTISITAYLNSVSFAYMNGNSYRHCWKMGSLWMLGESGSIITAFFLTLERYLVIVYSLNPDIRITRKMAAILISVCWLFAISLTGYALHFNLYRFTFLCIPVRFDTSVLGAFIFTVIVIGLSLISYLFIFVFYIRIYKTVKQTAQNAGVKRESKLAKRVSILVCSNVFFFCFPVVISGIISSLENLKLISEIDDLVFEMSVKVFPAICLSLNSFLNPFLHAFRNDRFTQALKARFRWLGPIVTFIRGLIRRNPRVNPENHTTNVKRS